MGFLIAGVGIDLPYHRLQFSQLNPSAICVKLFKQFSEMGLDLGGCEVSIVGVDVIQPLCLMPLVQVEKQHRNSDDGHQKD